MSFVNWIMQSLRDLGDWIEPAKIVGGLSSNIREAERIWIIQIARHPYSVVEHFTLWRGEFTVYRDVKGRWADHHFTQVHLGLDPERQLEITSFNAVNSSLERATQPVGVEYINLYAQDYTNSGCARHLIHTDVDHTTFVFTNEEAFKKALNEIRAFEIYRMDQVLGGFINELGMELKVV